MKTTDNETSGENITGRATTIKKARRTTNATTMSLIGEKITGTIDDFMYSYFNLVWFYELLF
jgi:hypothetical protein